MAALQRSRARLMWLACCRREPAGLFARAKSEIPKDIHEQSRAPEGNDTPAQQREESTFAGPAPGPGGLEQLTTFTESYATGRRRPGPGGLGLVLP